MEINGDKLWTEIIRPIVVAKGPRRVLQLVTKTYDVPEWAIDPLLEGSGATDILRRVGRALADGEDSWELADGVLLSIARARRRLTPKVALIADDLAIAMLDAWASEADNPGAEVSAVVIQALGRPGRTYEFDAGVPGSGQSITAWKLGARFFLLGEGGASGIADSEKQLFEDWKNGR